MPTVDAHIADDAKSVGVTWDFADSNQAVCVYVDFECVGAGFREMKYAIFFSEKRAGTDECVYAETRDGVTVTLPNQVRVVVLPDEKLVWAHSFPATVPAKYAVSITVQLPIRLKVRLEERWVKSTRTIPVRLSIDQRCAVQCLHCGKEFEKAEERDFWTHVLGDAKSAREWDGMCFLFDA